MKDHYRKLQNMYLQANINTMIFDTTTCYISKGQSEITLQLAPKYYHALNAMHGLVYFKLLDDSAFFAVNSIVYDVFVLTTSFTINITKPASHGLITAKGQTRFTSTNLMIGESSLYNEEGEEIAFGTGTFAKSKIALSNTPGYQ